MAHQTTEIQPHFISSSLIGGNYSSNQIMGQQNSKSPSVQSKVEQVKETKESRLESVYNKLKNSPYATKLTDDEMRDLSWKLSDPAEIIKSYLSTDWADTIKMHQENMKREQEYKKKAISLFSSTPDVSTVETSTPSKSTSSNVSTIEADEEEDVSFDGGEPTNEDFEKSKINPEFALKKEVKIKLIISELANTKSKKAQRKIISPILSTLNIGPNLGMFHSALMIGPWLIEWNNSSICIPRKCVSTAALVSADINSISTSTKIEETVQILAQVITDWNVRNSYSTFGKKSHEGNCQDFVEEVLSKMGVSYKFTGPLDTFLKQLKEKGNSDLVFAPTPDFVEKFKLDKKTYQFTDHASLDTFVQNLMEKDMEFQQKHKDEYAFLKSFDRAFWLRAYKFPNNVAFRCIQKKGEDEDDVECACPFRDPQETGSIKFL